MQPSTKCHANSILRLGLDGLTKLVAVERPMCNRKTNLRSFIDSHSSNNHEILAKIGLVDVEIIGLIEIVKNKYETTAEQKPTFGGCTAAGGLITAA